MMKFKQLPNYYAAAALIFLNAVIVFLFMNMAFSLALWVKDHYLDAYLTPPNPVSLKYVKYVKPSRNVYPELNEQQIDALLKESWGRPYLYEPFTGFRESPYHGRYVNVNENGFRVTANQGPWPTDPAAINIFLFGGSTTFGYGVSDHETIASYLQEYLTTKLKRDIRVYNFGRGDYYSSQERILFEQLLTAGHVPDLAIFVDGLNDFYYNEEKPFLTDRFEAFLSENHAVVPEMPSVIAKLAVTRVALAINRRIEFYLRKKDNAVSQGPAIDARTNEEVYDDPSMISRVINRYLNNKKIIDLIAQRYGVIPVFIWQPVPTFRYDERFHPFIATGYGGQNRSRYGYKTMEAFVRTHKMGVNFVWAADIQEGLKEPLYVDKVHYTAKFSKQLAIFIGDSLLQRHLSPSQTRAKKINGDTEKIS